MSDAPLPPQVVIHSVVSDQFVGTTAIADDGIATGVPPETKLIIVNPVIRVPPPQVRAAIVYAHSIVEFTLIL